MFQKARDNSVPLDTIERAVKRGTGELEGVNYESITYEGYAPGGVALLIETLSDNRNRTGSEIRSLLSKNGGSHGRAGCGGRGSSNARAIVNVARSVDEDDIMMVGLDNGAEDVEDLDELWQVTCDPSDAQSLQSALEAAGIDVLEAGHGHDAVEHRAPRRQRPLPRRCCGWSMLLDDHDDVQDVFSNVDIPDDGARGAQLWTDR